MNATDTIATLLIKSLTTELRCCGTCKASWLNFNTGHGYCKKTDPLCPKPVTEEACCEKWEDKHEANTCRDPG